MRACLATRPALDSIHCAPVAKRFHQRSAEVRGRCKQQSRAWRITTSAVGHHSSVFRARLTSRPLVRCPAPNACRARRTGSNARRAVR